MLEVCLAILFTFLKIIYSSLTINWEKKLVENSNEVKS